MTNKLVTLQLRLIARIRKNSLRSLSDENLDAQLSEMFFGNQDTEMESKSGLSVADEEGSKQFREAGFLGELLPSDAFKSSRSVYLNTNEPFCLVTVGVQGSGKSHTMGVVLENCMIPCNAPSSRPLVRLQRAMTAVVLHYDQNESSICEATGLTSPSPLIDQVCHSFGSRDGWALPSGRMVILVSPSNYLRRKQFYGDRFDVKPLLFHWRHLTADHLKRIMRIKEGDQQLYVASMLDLLRKYQRQSTFPKFDAFVKQVQDMCNLPGQGAALSQRINLLKFLIYDSEENCDIREQSSNLIDSLEAGQLVIVDLTDPLLAKDEANGIFQVLVEQFRTAPRSGPEKLGGRLLVLDEAHRFMDGTSSDGLSNAIVDAARVMRHDGLRVAVSTQSPKALAPELLELVSVAVLHRFHSRDWHTCLTCSSPISRAEGETR